MSKLLVVLWAWVGLGAETLVAQVPETVVYVVRHAEKVTTDPADRDPELTPAGYRRARALPKVLRQEKIEALFASQWQRTHLTLAPLAQQTGKTIQRYEAANATVLAEQIRKNYAGKTVVVAGHSNTVLETIEALGATRPLASLADHEYDYLFKVIINAAGQAIVNVQRYGAPSQEKAKPTGAMKR